MEEIEASSFFFTLDVFYCQLIILLKDLGFKQMSMEPVFAEPEMDYAIREEDIPQILEEYDKLAVESGKAILAAFLCIYVAKLKLIAYFLIYNARIYVAQKELLISYKLMAGVEITPWSNCQILCT